MLESFSFKTKMLLLSGVLALFTVLGSGVGILAMNSLVKDYSPISDEVIPQTQLISNIRGVFREIRIQVRSLAIEDLPQDQADQFAENTLDNVGKLESLLKDYLALPKSPNEEEIARDLEERWNSFKAVGVAILTAYQNGMEKNKKEIVRLILINCPATAGAVQTTLDDILKYQSQKADSFVAAAKTQEKNSLFLSLSIASVSVISALGIGILFGNQVSRRLEKESQLLMTESKNLDVTSEALFAQSQNALSTTKSTTAALTSAASAVEQIRTIAEKNSDYTMSSSQEAQNSLNLAAKGKTNLEELRTKYSELETQISDLAKTNQSSVDELFLISSSIKEIQSKVSVINEIVFQTKLLSFNASVEAARAGEAGKGFSVVAEEVGQLAKMSGDAAVEIFRLISESSQKVESISKTSQEKSKQIVDKVNFLSESSRKSLEHTVQAFDTLEKDVQKITARLNEIARGTEEQTKGINEVSTTIARLEGSGQSVLTSSAEILELSEDVKSKIADFSEVSKKLSEMVKGQAA